MLCKASFKQALGQVDVFIIYYITTVKCTDQFSSVIITLIMAKLTRDDVLKLARLARLQLTDEEVVEYSEELSEILQYVEQLSSVDVKGLEPTNQITGLTNVTRPDEVKDYGYQPAELQKNLPEAENDLIKVNRMIG
jgi:aspartyl-tRNA(Asn)/glutamyl-tRNA(Gln) amidotransferase subunit C